jgi:membrane-bound serine protease (ClpP class)
MENVSSWSLIFSLIGAGALLLVAEIFAPGLILGILGALCLLASILLTFSQHGSDAGFVVLFLELAGFSLGLTLWMKYFSRTSLGRGMILHTSNPDESRHKFSSLQDATGLTVTACRPAGLAEFHGRRYDVVAETSFLESGQPVKVVLVEGARIVIRPHQP